MAASGESRSRRAVLAKPPSRARNPLSPGSLFLRLRRVLGRHLSVRLKLTLYYGLMCLLTLAIAGGVMYWTVDRQLSTQIDQGLINSGSLLDQKLASVPLVPFKAATQTSQLRGECAQKWSLYQRYISARVASFCLAAQHRIDLQAVLVSQPGVVAGIAFAAPLIHFPQYVPFIELCPLESKCFFQYSQFEMGRLYAGQVQNPFSTRIVGNEQLRVYERRLSIPAKLKTSVSTPVLFVYRSTQVYQNVRHTIFVTLLLGIPLGVIIALAAGFLIARAALRPIGRISRTVRAIGDSKDLSRRVGFIGPHDEIGRLADTFDGMMDRIEIVFDTQKRFVADASHELRTPLTAIRGNADLLRIAPPEEREACITSIRKESVRMSRLVDDLLLLAEAEAGEGQIHRTPIALDEVLLDVYQTARAIAEGKVELVLDSADHVTVNGDADRLKQLMLNLVDNAVKFTPQGGAVSVGLTREGDTARLTVSDSGIGIAPEEQAAIFHRFYRVETSRSSRGSGLGLSIVSWIIQEHGGHIDISSAPDKGTTFTVILPLYTGSSATAGV